MSLKKTIIFALGFVLLISFSLSMTVNANEEVNLRLGNVNPPDHPMVMSMAYFGEQLAEKTDGRITVSLYPSGQLGGVDAMLEQARAGEIDIAAGKPDNIAAQGYEKINVLGLPFIFRDLEHAWEVRYSEVGEELLFDDMLEADIGLVGLGYLPERPRNIFTTEEPVTSIEDMQGLDIRVFGRVLIDTMEALGANAIDLPFAELYSALQTGVVDAGENPISGYYANRFHEVAPYYTYSGHEQSPTIQMISAQTWNNLSEEDQELILETWEEAEDYFRDVYDDVIDEYLEALEEEGAEFYELEDREQWVEAVEPVYEEHAGEYLDIVDRIEEVGQ